MPKKINTSVRKAKMEILETVKRHKKSVLFKSPKQAYKIFKDMVDYDTSVYWK